MFLLSRDFGKICIPEALETVDADGEDRVEAEVTVVDLEELAVDQPAFHDFGIVRLCWPIPN